jgi:site-specific DNA-methyltransferase (adenine-specific)
MLLAETQARTPDILEVIADLSSDEVFTPPRVANAMLDLLPDEVWSDPTLRWLDPGSKTGVFLREITKRLMVGLEQVIPDRQERLEHILREQVFGIAITQLTAWISRRTLYCSKDASADHVPLRMADPAGNVWFQRIEHRYNRNGRCTECGAPRDQMERDGKDNYAYGFIHTEGRKAIAEEFDMQFDVIVGNPPYQMDTGGQGRQATPLYNIFVEHAKELNPRYITMVVPSRWVAGGMGLSKFRLRMLNDRRLRALVDYENAADVFPQVGINGGVCFFLWDRDNEGDCETTFHRSGEEGVSIQRDLGEFDILVRDPRALDILRKVLSFNEESLGEMVSGTSPFGLPTNFDAFRSGAEPDEHEVRVYANRGTTRVQGAMSRSDVDRNAELRDAWKVLVPEAGSGREREKSGVDVVLGPPILAEPRSVCTHTYLAIGPLPSREQAESVESYLRTRFFRFLVSLRKISQHALPGVYTWVPQQTWDREWTDEELFTKYGITEEEQAYIVERIREAPA